MDRLQTELQRLYAAAGGGTRSLVLELGHPARWDALAPAWQGVQAELEWPEPAIAVNGRDGYQLWFSLEEAVAADVAAAILESLRARFLHGVAPERLRLLPAADLQSVPRQQGAGDHWSAFLAPDLASLFADEPWLDHPPSADAQADLLSRFRSVAAEAVAKLLEAPVAATPSPVEPAPAAPGDDDPARQARRFLLSVMNDPQLEMALRIEAAKALLPRG